MSHSPFDGVLLEDGREPIPGAVALQLHLRVDRALARRDDRPPLALPALQDRAAACRELLAHGLFPDVLRTLGRHGLDLGDPHHPRSLAALARHLEAYLAEAEAEGYLEPDRALWQAVEAQREGRRGLWVERGAADGPLRVGLGELKPARLRALATLPELGPVVFRLAAARDGGASGLFGSGQPLVDWLMQGLEDHGHHLPADLRLEAPEGWGQVPWAAALGRLFEGPLPLDEPAQSAMRRGRVEGPADLLRHGVEQLCAWVAGGLDPRALTVVHPHPERIAPLLEPLLAAEGLALHVRGGLRPLKASAAWAPLWALLEGLGALDPCAVAAGLRASRHPAFSAWAEHLALADTTGEAAFPLAWTPLRPAHRERAARLWDDLDGLRRGRLPARAWAERLGRLAYALDLPGAGADLFEPLSLLASAWGDEVWDFPALLEALQAFLEAAKDPAIPRRPEGVRLLAPTALLEGWTGCEAALVLDLSEGAWPAAPGANADLDAERQWALNAALVAATRAGDGDPLFPPALQRFWLPRCEAGELVPRAFQREAYAFNTLLALTRRELVALTPGQDAEGRACAQGPFWTALEGAGTWAPDPARAASALRLHWDAGCPVALDRARAAANLAREPEAAAQAEAPEADHAPGLRALWLKGAEAASPTALEGLARCPFRSRAERVWGLQVQDPGSRVVMARGTLVHALLEALLRPFVGRPDWPAAARQAWALEPRSGVHDLEALVATAWAQGREGWLAECRELPEEHHAGVSRQVEESLPRLAAFLEADLAATAPPPEALTLLGLAPREGPWTRTLLDLEASLGPVDLTLPSGRILAVAGKADRLERYDPPEGSGLVLVVDYKTSTKARLAAYAEGEAAFSTHLQPALYALLARRSLGMPAAGVLVPLREDSPDLWAKGLKPLAEAPDWEAALLAALDRLDARLERGDFPPTPGAACAHCGLSALCGRPVDLEPAEGAE